MQLKKFFYNGHLERKSLNRSIPESKHLIQIKKKKKNKLNI